MQATTYSEATLNAWSARKCQEFGCPGGLELAGKYRKPATINCVLSLGSRTPNAGSAIGIPRKADKWDWADQKSPHSPRAASLQFLIKAFTPRWKLGGSCYPAGRQPEKALWGIKAETQLAVRVKASGWDSALPIPIAPHSQGPHLDKE